MNNSSGELAKRILAGNQYITLSTVVNNMPWCSTLTYAFDENYTLYFMSHPHSRHVQELCENNRVSGTIFDSQLKWGDGVGLQIVGSAHAVDEGEVAKVSQLFFEREYPYGGVPPTDDMFKAAIESGAYYFYKIYMEEVWVTDPDADVDGRVLVSLSR
jgi:uncharacterized protein YhbP (UPF0306 family)